MKNNLKKLFAVLLTMALVVSMFVIPTQAALPSGAAANIVNGDFETSAVGEAPIGWTLTATNSDLTLDHTSNWAANHKAETIADGTDNKVVAFSKKGTGYAALTSAPISVEGNTGYRFSYDYKTVALQVTEGVQNPFYGLRVMMRQYDKNGKLLGPTGEVLADAEDNLLDQSYASDTSRVYNATAGKVKYVDRIRAKGLGDGLTVMSDYETICIDITTHPNTANVVFYLATGGHYQTKATINIDNVALKKYTSLDVPNGDFEAVTHGVQGGRANDEDGPCGWTMETTNNSGYYFDDPAVEGNAIGDTYTNNYKIVTTNDGKNGKAMKITSALASGLDRGYVLVMSPLIKVTPGSLPEISFDYKTEGAWENKQNNLSYNYARIWFYDANGNFIDKKIGAEKAGYILPSMSPATNLGESADWTNITLNTNDGRIQGQDFIDKIEYVRVVFCQFGIWDYSSKTMYIDNLSVKRTENDIYAANGIEELTVENSGQPSANSTQFNAQYILEFADDGAVKVGAIEARKQDARESAYGRVLYWHEKTAVEGGAKLTVSYDYKVTGYTEGLAAYERIIGSAASSIGEKPMVRVRYFDANGDVIYADQNGNVTTGNIATVAATSRQDCDWTEVTGSVTAPENAVTAQVGYFFFGGNAPGMAHVNHYYKNVSIFTCTNHVYDDNCDEDCNLCLAKRTAPHTYDNACDVDCNDCGDVRDAAHAYDNACDAECNECGDIRVVPHSYDNDCDEDCNLCGTPRTVTHDYDGDCDEECNACGDTRTPAANHAFANDCDTECDVCKATRQPAADHQYTDACDAECNVCQAPRTASHDYDSECDTKCNLCEEPRTTTVNHNWDAGEVTKPADCKDKGEMTYTCNDCKETKTEDINKTGHTLGNWTVSDPASCEQAGEQKRECSKCDYEETKPIAALGHDFGEPTVTEPTCTQDGITETACTRCDEKETAVVSKTGHNYGEWEVTKEATENEKGTKTKTCETCGDKKTEDIPKLAPSTDADTDTDEDDETSSDFEWYWILVIGVPVILAGGGAALLITKKRK